MFSHVTGWSSWRWPQKGVNSTATNKSLLLKLEHLVNAPWFAILMITVCWSNWNVSLQAGTIHMTCRVISHEITLEKCICVSRTIVSTVPPSVYHIYFFVPQAPKSWSKLVNYLISWFGIVGLIDLLLIDL